MFIPARKKFLKGFTLIELLIVIAILGILAAAVLVAINPTKRQNQAKDSNTQSDIASLATALQAYYTAPGTGSYPSLLATLVANGDLKQLPTPGGTVGAYQTNYAVQPASGTTCGPDSATPTVACAEAAIYYLLFDQASGGTVVWCWESVTSKAQKITAAANCDFSATTL